MPPTGEAQSPYQLFWILIFASLILDFYCDLFSTCATLTIMPTFTIRSCDPSEVEDLCKKYHAYQSGSASATYCYGVYEDNSRLVAGYAWQPPPIGAAKHTCPECPQGVLALSRMIAVPKPQRALKHISKPLRYQMHTLIDRTRWPVLITYADLGCGHTGYVYKCSGWIQTELSLRPILLDATGARKSKYSSDGASGNLTQSGTTTVQRWEHWITPRGTVEQYMTDNGWRREPVPGRFYRSGNPAYTYVKDWVCIRL